MGSGATLAKVRRRKLWLALAVLYAGVAVYQMKRPLPAGVSIRSEVHHVPAASVAFLADRTWVDESSGEAEGQRHTEQVIFDEVLRMIGRAQQYVLLDLFLYNSWQGAAPERTRALADELTAALLEKRRARPGTVIAVVSDPINTAYGGARSPHLEELAAAGIPVVLTDLAALRDSNPLYSALWRLTARWLGNSVGGRAPHPFQADGQPVSVRSWLALLNFKANHRKLVVADEPQADGTTKLVTLATSANPHDGSSAHGNVAVRIADGLWREAVASEQAVGAFSEGVVLLYTGAAADEEGPVAVQLLTEGEIRARLLELLAAVQAGDAVDVAMFYLSDRAVVRSLLAAAQRGVAVRLVLDPNKDAFGRTKNGVPNRPVAHELVQRSRGAVAVRWCDTHGEQCHAKLVLVRRGDQVTLVAGSANLTRRNIGGFNLETDVLVAGDKRVPALAAAQVYFNDLWENRGGRRYTVGYEAYADDSWFKAVLYRVQEATGLSSF